MAPLGRECNSDYKLEIVYMGFAATAIFSGPLDSRIFCPVSSVCSCQPTRLLYHGGCFQSTFVSYIATLLFMEPNNALCMFN
ncbi:hypothetical protein PILCRDRAFT_812469 [Piloderma croceum F 1598]|uniref:Uncharacterized protein n=1 Tax=Piloderma croceum (strain F 1598) TaxID=765440 RepID=A0A0C3BT06_PILCF|nr:hypothetical protein PILCRDRAFT_812469 [Piloderma croceum F 1598]